MRTWIFAAVLAMIVVAPLSVASAGERDHGDGGHQHATQQANTDKPATPDKPAEHTSGKPGEVYHESRSGNKPSSGGPKWLDIFHPSHHEEAAGGHESAMPIHLPGLHTEMSHGDGYSHHDDHGGVLVSVKPEGHYHPDYYPEARPHERPVVVHEEVVVREAPRYHRFHTDPVALLAGVLIAGAVIASAERPACPPPCPEDIARRHDTYFSCREEALANFKAKYVSIYTNAFACEPASRPCYIPKETDCDGHIVYIVYCQEYKSYGFWDPANPNSWITYCVWNDDTMVDRLLLDHYYLYPTR